MDLNQARLPIPPPGLKMLLYFNEIAPRSQGYKQLYNPTTIDTDKIDSDYMNSKFDKYLKLLEVDEASAEELKNAEAELHKTFATLSQEEQKFANISESRIKAP